MKAKEYYEQYWLKRGLSPVDPIPSWIPAPMKKFTVYGAVLNQIPENSKILDLGCGEGNVTSLYFLKGEVTGVDISSTALNKASRRRIKTMMHDLNIYPYPIKSKSFDVVVLTDVLEHLVDPVSTLKECHRILNGNGRLIVTVPNFSRLENRIRMLWGDPTDLLHFDKYGDELEHMHWFTVGKLKHLAKNSGFSAAVFVPTGLQNLGFMFGIAGLNGLAKFLTCVFFT